MGDKAWTFYSYKAFFFFFCLPIFKVFGLDVESKFQISCPPVSMVLLKMLRLLFNTECLIKQGLMHYFSLLLKHFRHNSVSVLRRWHHSYFYSFVGNLSSKSFSYFSFFLTVQKFCHGACLVGHFSFFLVLGRPLNIQNSVFLQLWEIFF